MTDKIFNVLFLCTGNSARSIMAEALLNKLGAGRFKAYSAGSNPVGAVNPYAINQLQKEELPIDGLRSKSWDEFSQPDAPVFDFVITVCDNAANEVCPTWLGHPVTAHWGVMDPAAAPEESKNIAFAQAFAILERRISLFTALNHASLERLMLEKQVRDIAHVA